MQQGRFIVFLVEGGNFHSSISFLHHIGAVRVLFIVA